MTSSKFKYIIKDRSIFERPLLLMDTLSRMDKINHVRFSLGKRFDEYKFHRQTVTFEQVTEALKARVLSLRKKYDYVRLWFSGGQDCRLAIDTFIKYNIKIDEIVVARRCSVSNLGLYPEFDPLTEIDSSAVKWLDENKSKFPDTKITIMDLDDPHHESVFESDRWYLNATEWFFSVSYLPPVFHRFVNPKFNLLEKHNNMCELIGPATPSLYYDRNEKSWKFFFGDASFSGVGPAIDDNIFFEDFLITDDDPELLNLHVNSIIDDYEKTGEFPDYSQNYRQQERLVKNRSLFFKNMNYSEFQLSKNDANFDFPSDDYFWRARQSSRTYYEMINRYHQRPMARCLQLYRDNTDWNLIKLAQTRSFKTSVWKLS